MKKIAFLIIAALVLSITSCKNKDNKNPETLNNDVSDTIQNKIPETTSEKSSSNHFNTDAIPISNAELGEIPFFTLPKGIDANGKPVKRSFDRLFFPLDGVMTPIEGKVWKADFRVSANSEEDWSLPYFQKSYDDAITAVGGVKIYDGKVPREELDRIEPDATYFGENGSLDYWNNPTRVYIIRRTNGDDIYIQLSGDSAMGALQILQKAPFEQTITILKSDQIQKDLNEKGKAVLHINFDTDKATLKADGNTAVAEIEKALKADHTLNISINGYTDNTGNAAHNLQLSKDRANTVKKAIIASGIEADRLASDGFGSKAPLSDNATEEGRAQNRRVELLKK